MVTLEPINILVTLDANYLKPLKVMLKSMFLNNPDDSFHVFLMHSRLTEEQVNDVDEFVGRSGHSLSVVTIGEDCFNDAPIVKHYTKEMYYRLLAFRYLPTELERILYLDPDILVINSIRSLYTTDLSGWLFAAAHHDIILTREINKLRFPQYEINEYFNTGVLLMNLNLIRERVNEHDIYQFVEKHRNSLILPDQDILNSLYSKNVKKLDELIYNYDVRYFGYNRLLVKHKPSMEEIINKTVILHFCGKRQPWHKNYRGDFHALYKHYEKLALGGSGTY